MKSFPGLFFKTQELKKLSDDKIEENYTIT